MSTTEPPIGTTPSASNPPRILIIGAGSRGRAYARAVRSSTSGVVAAVAEPDEYKRTSFGRSMIWGTQTPPEGASFTHWREFIEYEAQRRARIEAGETDVPPGVDAAFVCVLDDIPHNLLLRQLVVRDRVIGDILSVSHTEPVGWYHFAHSYVRGNWRREKTSAPSLLTKCCHDVDLLLWFLCSPPDPSDETSTPHLPSTVTSIGSLQYFKRSRKPPGAGSATNCLSCPVEPDCKFSAKRIYVGPEVVGLETMNTGWPVKIVVPDIESCGSMKEAKAALLAELAKDYDEDTPEEEVSRRNWFGRCVYECENDVCDEQVVTISWDEEPLAQVDAPTKKVCERYTHLYGVNGEIFADSETITVEDFRTGKKTVHQPAMECSGHGGGDIGLTRQFVLAVDKVKNHDWTTNRAQRELIGCTLEEVIRSHAMVFCAEEARRGRKVVDWREWWSAQVEGNVSRILA
ncbi:hypothetical protein VTJ49DRAFT_2708 [Mycothermus thermophilus]|uniref:Streptomycin biosynthesis protein StrI n=1 Tax=Humicola insolens TaxID=85995 RepID=A0ABR3VAI6_HUMIN